MVNAVLFTSDVRLSGEVYVWMKDLTSVRLARTFKTLEDFKAEAEGKQQQPVAQVANGAPAGAPASGPENAEDKQMRILIIDADLLPAKPIQWITELKKYVQSNGLADPTGNLRVLILAFDGGNIKIDAFQNDIVDDLILKPLDKSLFLQKVELLTGEKAKSASFLFRQKTNQTIEVGKDIVIDEISEFAIAVRNPGPLTEGVFAAVHCDAFGEKASRRMIARVYESTRHPVREGEYLVKFSYFGITPEQLSNVRRYVKNNQTQLRTKGLGGDIKMGGMGGMGKSAAGAAGTPGAAGAPGKMPSVGFMKIKKFALIEMNPDILAEAKSILETGFKSVAVKPYPSYARLMGEIRRFSPGHRDSDASSAQAPSDTGASQEPAFPGGKKIEMILRGRSFEVVKIEPYKRTDTILGKPANEWVDRPDLFTQAVERDDKEGFIEFLSALESGSSGKTAVRARDHANRIVHISVTGSLEKSGATDGVALLKLELEEVNEAKWKELSPSAQAAASAPKDVAHYRFEAILIDGAFIRPDPQAWITGFEEALRSSGVLAADAALPKIIVLIDPRSSIRPEDLRVKGITDFMYKPLDRRFIMQKFPALMPNLQYTREPESPPFIPCELQGRIGKEVTMDELSEFGLTILQPSPFREKIYMRFFSKLFGEDGGWVAGRCLECERPKEGEPYRCHFSFFGPSDDLLKRIRTWIREDYVARKENAEKKA